MMPSVSKLVVEVPGGGCPGGKAERGGADGEGEDGREGPLGG